MDEKVTGFEFTKTHTWLMVNRVNYTIDKDWKIGAEYRILTVQEAKDQKRGLLVEAVHSVNDNVELGIKATVGVLLEERGMGQGVVDL